MATVTLTIPSKFHRFQNSNQFPVQRSHNHVFTSPNIASITRQDLCTRLLNPCKPYEGGSRCFPKPVSAVGSGLEASITDPQDNAITLKDAKIVVEFRDDDKIQLRVDVTGEETQKTFDQVLTSLGRTAPPIPGFRRQKGGRTSNVPKSFLLQIIGEERVTKFVIREIVNVTMADYVKKENLTVKDKKINTIQTAEELKALFTPGNEFGFNAIMELETSQTETTSSGSSDVQGNDK